MRNGMALFREQGIRFPLPLCTVLLAEIEGEMGRIGPALTTLDDALADAERTGQHHFDVELHRQRGALLLRKTPNVRPLRRPSCAPSRSLTVSRHEPSSFALR